MSDSVDDAQTRQGNSASGARVIAAALARTADHHRRTALTAGVIALASCGLAFASERPAAKGVALALGILFAVFCYRGIRAANSYIDPMASPVLLAIAKAPQDLLSIVFDPELSLVRIRTQAATLDVRINDDTPLEPLLQALSRHAPNATVTPKAAISSPSVS